MPIIKERLIRLKRMDSVKPKVDVYRVNPTFTLDEDLLQEFREIVWKSIKANRLQLMADGRTLKWVDELIAKEKATKKPAETKTPVGVG